MRYSRPVKFLLSVAVTLLTLYFLFRGIPSAVLEEHFIFSWHISIITLLFFFAIKILNTVRFSVVYNTPPSKALFLDLCYANMMLSIFPFRLGELSYINRLQKITALSYPDVTARLIKIRLFDYGTVYLILMLSSLYVYTTFSSVVKMVSLFFVVSLIVGFILVILIFKYNLMGRIPIPKIALLLTALNREIKSGLYTTPKNELKIFLYSIGYWLLRLLFGYVVLLLLGIHVSFVMIAFISLAVFLISLIPIQFFAGFGVTEAGFLFFLTQLGFAYNSTLALLLVYHVYLLIPVIFFGVLSWLLLNSRWLGKSE